MLGPLTPDRYRRAPFATGRITALDGAPGGDKVRIRAAGQRWAFDQDIGLAASSAPPPPDADVTAGRWWPAGLRRVSGGGAGRARWRKAART